MRFFPPRHAVMMPSDTLQHAFFDFRCAFISRSLHRPPPSDTPAIFRSADASHCRFDEAQMRCCFSPPATPDAISVATPAFAAAAFDAAISPRLRRHLLIADTPELFATILRRFPYAFDFHFAATIFCRFRAAAAFAAISSIRRRFRR